MMNVQNKKFDGYQRGKRCGGDARQMSREVKK